MISPIIKLKTDTLNTEYYEDIPLIDFLNEISPLTDNNVFIEKEEHDEEEILEDKTISFTKRALTKDSFIEEFIDFTENPEFYRGIAYRRIDPKYQELASILYIYKSNNDYYIQYQYPISYEDNILIASGFIDTAIKNYDIEIKDTKDEADEESFMYGLALTYDEGQIRYDYSGGKLNKGLDFTLISNVEELTEEQLDLFTIGEEGQKCLTYIIRTDEANYIYLKNLDTNIEYIYEEIEYKEIGKATFYQYIFLSRCEDGIFYDEHNIPVETKENSIYELYIKPYVDKIEEFEKNYLKPCGMIKGFPEINKDIFSLDKEMSKRTNEISFYNQNLTPGSIIRTLKKY